MEIITMTMHREDTSIIDFLKHMKNTSVRLLPSSSQFNFDKDTILDFLDSVIQKYPISVILVKCKHAKIKSRPFTINYMSGVEHKHWSYGDPSSRLYVLDGHQRLQTLYSAYFGSFDGERLFYDLSFFGEGRRFIFSEKKESSVSLVRMNEVASVRQVINTNDVFKAYNMSIHDFVVAFYHSLKLHVTTINISKIDVGDIGTAYGEGWSIKDYQNKLEVILNMLSGLRDISYLRDLCNRLGSFLESVQNSEQ